MIDFPDNRPLAELPLGLLVPEERREALAVVAREILADCGVRVAEDVAKLGCTGVVAAYLHEPDLTAKAKEVRDALGGSGVIFPCFVGPDRYCLVHETIGGLQDGQLPRHQEVLEHVSRPLLPSEKKHNDIVESARRKSVREAYDTLSAVEKEKMSTAFGGGIDVVEEDGPQLECRCKEIYPQLQPGKVTHGRGCLLLPVDVAHGLEDMAAARALAAAVEKIRSSFSCHEHEATVWSCRFCLAAEIVKGEYEPPLIYMLPDATWAPVNAAEVTTTIAALEDADRTEAALFVCVAKWRRKLARD